MPSNLIEALPGRLEKALSGLTKGSEEVHVKLKGAFKEGLVVTSQRVIVVKGGWMAGQLFGTNVFQIPLSSVAGVEVKYSLLSGYFEVSAGGMQNTDKSYWSQKKGRDPKSAPNCVSITGGKRAEVFREACSAIISLRDRPNAPLTDHLSTSSSLDAIGQLGRLRDSGYISDDEFSEKKRELLSRLR